MNKRSSSYHHINMSNVNTSEWKPQLGSFHNADGEMAVAQSLQKAPRTSLSISPFHGLAGPSIPGVNYRDWEGGLVHTQC